MTHLNTSNTNYGQKKGQKSNCQFDSRPVKVNNRPNLRADDMCHTIGKLLMKATNLLQTSPRWEVCTQNYKPSKLRESHLREFRDSNLGVLAQNDI